MVRAPRCWLTSKSAKASGIDIGHETAGVNDRRDRITVHIDHDVDHVRSGRDRPLVIRGSRLVGLSQTRVGSPIRDNGHGAGGVALAFLRAIADAVTAKGVRISHEDVAGVLKSHGGRRPWSGSQSLKPRSRR